MGRRRDYTRSFRHVAASGERLPVVTLATYRHSELRRDDALAALLADLHTEPRSRQFVLSGLLDTDVVDLIAAAAGHDLDASGVELAHALYRETNGNPFFVGELLRHLGESGEIAQGDDGRYRVTGLDRLSMPQSVRDVIGRRVARLGEEATRVLSLAAVVGQAFDVDLLVQLADIRDGDVLDVLDRAVAAALLVEDRERVGSYRFAHTLIQHTLYQDLSCNTASARACPHRRAPRSHQHRRRHARASLARGDPPGRRGEGAAVGDSRGRRGDDRACAK